MKKTWKWFKRLPWYAKILLFLPVIIALLALLFREQSFKIIGMETLKKHMQETFDNHDEKQEELEKQWFVLDKQERKIRNEIQRIVDNFNAIDNDVDRAINAEQLQMLYDKLIARARRNRERTKRKS